MGIFTFPGTNYHDLNLDWLLNQMKTCLAEWETVKGQFSSLQEYVANYFANLDVSEEISAKLDEMAASGELLAIASSLIQSTTTSYLASVITNPDSPPLDRTLTQATAAAPADLVGDLEKDIGSLQFSFDWVSVYQPEAGANRWYHNFGMVKGLIKPVHTHASIWCAVQGYDTSTYDGTKVYDSGKINGVAVYVDSEKTNLYYRVVFGVDSGRITDDMIAGSYIDLYTIKTDSTLTNVGMAANAKAVGEMVTAFIETDVERNLLSRNYAYLGLVNGIYKAVAQDPAIWFALQGYDTSTYDGTRVYDSGQMHGEHVFTIENNENVYYRIVFGVSSGSMTQEQVDGIGVYVRTYVNDAVVEHSRKIKTLEQKIPTSLPTSIMTIMHGGTTAYPANTIGLYKKAYEAGIMYWECDVRPCLDGYVLCHDDDIYNHALTASGEIIPQGTVRISQSTVSTLKQYKFGIITNQQANGIVPGFENERIPTLEEFLLFAKAVGAHPVVEIKFTPTAAQMADICNIIKKFGMLDITYVLCYQDAANVTRYACENGIRNIAVIIDNGACTTEAVDTAYGYLSPYLDQLDDILFEPTIANYDETVAAYAASKGMRMGVWTVPVNPSVTTMVQLFNRGCTAYTTNKDNIADIIRSQYV